MGRLKDKRRERRRKRRWKKYLKLTAPKVKPSDYPTIVTDKT